jgi:hypothetical protein
MPLDFMNTVPQNIIPENNLRLPDALTIKHGPARLLSRFVLEGDKAARRMGLRLRLRHDFDELLFLNRYQAARGNWYKLPLTFDPECAGMTPENAFWISGEDDHGEIAVTWAGRIYDWPNTRLADEARTVFYGKDEGQPCIVTAPAAAAVTGVAIFGGASWVRPDYRGQQLYRLIPRIAKAYAFARWPIDWSFCYVTRALVDKGLAAGYGQKNLSYSILYPQSPWGDVEFALAYTSAADTYAEFASFMENELLPGKATGFNGAALPMMAEHKVTKTSSDGVLHGNSSLS